MEQTNQHIQNEPNIRVRQVYVCFLLLGMSVFLLSCRDDASSIANDRGTNAIQGDSGLIPELGNSEDTGFLDAAIPDRALQEDAQTVDSGLPVDAAISIDSGPSVDASTAPFVEVGTGDTQFVSIDSTSIVPFILGPQGGGSAGGYHVWLAFRSQGYAPRNIDVTVGLEDPSDNTVLNSMSRPLDLQPLGNYFGLVGIRLVLPDCCAVRSRSLRFRVTLSDTNQVTGTGVQTFTSSDICPDIDGNDIC